VPSQVSFDEARQSARDPETGNVMNGFSDLILEIAG
jgi:hypothetical protein